MIFTDLQQAIVDRLLWDAWFTDPDAKVSVIREDPLNLLAEYQKSIGKLGAVVIVAQPAIVETERIDLVNISIVLHSAENVTLNRSKSGSQKTGAENLIKAMALLRQWTPNEDMWAPFYLKGMTPIGEDEDGCYHHQLELYTYTMLELLVTLLGTERGTAIGDQDGKAFVVSPTPA
jgi:hypothetical protein